MSASHTKKARRENAEIVDAELRKHGIIEYSTAPTSWGHTLVRFACHGQSRSFTVWAEEGREFLTRLESK